MFCEHILLKPCISIHNVELPPPPSKQKKSCWDLCAGTVNAEL